jgi:hypothetical protein
VINYSSNRPDWRRGGEPAPEGGVYSQVGGPLGHPLASQVAYAPVIELAAALDTADALVLTPTGDAVLNAPPPPPGVAREITLQIESAGGAPRTVSFGAGFKTSGPLTVTATPGAVYVLRFVSDGATWNEASRSGPNIAGASGPARQPLP